MIESMKKPFNKLVALTGIGLMSLATPAWGDTPGSVVDADKSKPKQGEIQLAQALEKVSHPPAEKAPAPAPTKKGKFMGSDIRDWTGKKLEAAPFLFSDDRMAIIVYGEGRNALGAAQYAGKSFAKHMNIDVSYLHASDNDMDPDNSRIEVYADGRQISTLDVGINRTPREIAISIINDLKQGYAERFAIVAKAENDQSPSGMN